MVFASLIRFSAMACVGLVFVYMAELFPSIYRGTGVTLVCILGRLGSACAPFCTNYLSSKEI